MAIRPSFFKKEPEVTAILQQLNKSIDKQQVSLSGLKTNRNIDSNLVANFACQSHVHNTNP